MVYTTTESNKIVSLDGSSEYNSSYCTNYNLFPIVDKLPPDKKTSSSSDLCYLRRRIPPDKLIHSFTPNTFVVFKENYSLGSIIPSNNTDDGESSQFKEGVGDTSSPTSRSLVIIVM